MVEAGADAGSDSGADAGSTSPDSPAKAQTITSGQNVAGSLPPGTTSAHYYKYVPAQAFTSVAVNVTTLTPPFGGAIRWQTDTTIGLCDITGGLRCCDNAGSCNLTIREGTDPVEPGKTYYVIVTTSGPPLDYAFSITENP
ncbi:MAG: hypothetical protein KIT84_20295 [Labilithrix sp.]|nr:hypothetical protein [Labilithrix sp.]MCW5813381.1 hypothetical protein [Labilithrix sp.]